jgi:hypothetical protein
MIFGGFVLLLLLVPNDGTKRLGFLFCGGIVLTVGWLLRRVSTRHQERAVGAGQARTETDVGTASVK